MPKWNGSYELVEGFAREAISRNAEGLPVYARIYWNLNPDAAFFRETKADWPTLKRSFDAMLEQYPNARNLNGKAMFACAAGDAVTFNVTMAQLHGNLIPEGWIIAPELCRSRFAVAAAP
jgi:hypothetical protein